MPYNKSRYGNSRTNYSRRRRGYPQGSGGENKVAEFLSDAVNLPEDGSTLTAPAAADGGGITGTGTGTSAGRYSFHLIPGQTNETDPHPSCIGFGSRSRVVYSAAATVYPPNGSYGLAANSYPDGSFALAMVPKTSTGVNKYNEFSGRKYAIKGLKFKGSFFNTPSAGSGTGWATTDLWTGETIIKVCLVLVKDNGSGVQGGSQNLPFLTGTEAHKTLTAHALNNQVGQDWSRYQNDNAVNAFRDLDASKNVKILKQWQYELAATGGDEAFVPFEISHFFKKPLVVTLDKDSAGIEQGECSDVTKNCLWLLFMALGCVFMNYEGRLYFRDI